MMPLVQWAGELCGTVGSQWWMVDGGRRRMNSNEAAPTSPSEKLFDCDGRRSDGRIESNHRITMSRSQEAGIEADGPGLGYRTTSS